MVPTLLPVAREVVRRAQLLPSERVLDVGTGTGIAAAAAVGDGRRVVGLDAAPGMLDVARRDHPTIEFIEADMMSMPFPDGSFDVVISAHALLFADDRVAALREMRRVTAPGGRLSLSVPGPTELTPSAVLARVYGRLGLDARREYPTQDDLAAWATAAGWTGLETAADPRIAIRLRDDDAVGHWLDVGPSGVATRAWPAERRDAFRAAVIEAAPRDDDGAIRLPFGALYLTASTT